MTLIDYFSYNDGEEKLEEKGLISELGRMLEKLEEMSDSKAKEVFEESGWKTEIYVCRSFDWKFDAYKDGVAIEFEQGPQTKARWAWIKFEIAHRRSLSGLERVMSVSSADLDLGLLIINKEADASTKRCKEELESEIFDDVLNLSVPMVIADFDDT